MINHKITSPLMYNLYSALFSHCKYFLIFEAALCACACSCHAHCVQPAFFSHIAQH